MQKSSPPTGIPYEGVHYEYTSPQSYRDAIRNFHHRDFYITKGRFTYAIMMIAHPDAQGQANTAFDSFLRSMKINARL